MNGCIQFYVLRTRNLCAKLHIWQTWFCPHWSLYSVAKMKYKSSNEMFVRTYVNVWFVGMSIIELLKWVYRKIDYFLIIMRWFKRVAHIIRNLIILDNTGVSVHLLALRFVCLSVIVTTLVSTYISTDCFHFVCLLLEILSLLYCDIICIWGKQYL